MHEMKLRKRSLFLCLMLLIAAVLVTGCGAQDAYKENDRKGYNVSVKFDANGGTFASGNNPSIVDAFDVSQMPKDSAGKVQIPLLPPEGRKNVLVEKNGFFLLGWYAQRTDNGDGTYSYAQPWNFETDRVTVDPAEKHTSAEPVLTLYAAWAPIYKVEVYDLETKNLLGTCELNPNVGTELTLPHWDDASGQMKMDTFPQKEGSTYLAAYYDENGTQPVQEQTITHPGTVNKENGSVQNETLKIYTAWKAGQWYRISTAKQFADNFSLTGCYEIQSDLDFTDVIWPTACMHGNFSGVIQGNGYTFSNISIEQTNTNKVYTGLFGTLTETASVQNVTFQNVTLTIKKGSRLNGVAFGLLAGNLAAETAAQDVRFQDCRIAIDSGCYLAEDSFVIGLICGMGTTALDYSGITCVAAGENPETVNITVSDSTVQVQFGTEETI